MREIVVPGDMIYDKPIRMDNAFIEDGKTYSKVLGILEKEKGVLVPLEGSWHPRVGDTVIGIVTESKGKVYMVDLSYFGRAILVSSAGRFEARESFKEGDMIEARIKDIEDSNTIILAYPKVLRGGTFLSIKAIKVPRIVGRNDTMVRQIADLTGTYIIVGKNGMVWLKDGDIARATAAIRRIEAEAHTSGLTERIKKMLEEGSAARSISAKSDPDPN
jgi:exosome complex component RRP4